MALTDLCYRCPSCGRDPLDGKGDHAWCGSCGTRIARRRGKLFVSDARHKAHETSASNLVHDIDLHDGFGNGTFRPAPDFLHSARVLVAWRSNERAIRYKGALRGFAETMAPEAPGNIAARRDALSIKTPPAPAGQWSYLELRALQASSSCLHLSLPGDRLVQLRFEVDSPRRWEEMLRALVRDAYRRAGRGAVLEFQPRIEAAAPAPAGRS